MATQTMDDSGSASASAAGKGPKLDHPVHPAGVVTFVAVMLAGLAYAAVSVRIDTAHVGESIAIGALIFLGIALLIALAFEFVNGFHDTANAVATVIYTHALPPIVAVIWSGAFNFLGVLLSSGAVAYSIVTLLPVDLILGVGSAGGYAMIFALLLAAISWNLGTWLLGLPNSSSHALIGSILGVGVANQLLSGGGATTGVDWGQAQNVLLALLVSPLIGFAGAFGLLWAMKRVVPNPSLYKEPDADRPPPGPIRALLIFTCTAVSFAHGSNDGQKGMGLIMLILIGVAPTAYALNRTMPDGATTAFVSASVDARRVFRMHGAVPDGDIPAARARLKQALASHVADTAPVYGALDTLTGDVTQRLSSYGSIRQVPTAQTKNVRNDMYLVYDTMHLLTKDETRTETLFPGAQAKALKTYRELLEKATRYIPDWVKVTVALALGLGTMVGWRRIVVTVGERIGKTHMTYGMGAAAELIAASTILLAQVKGMPVSTTHILSSGVAGATVANGSSLQGTTVRNILLAWVLTLPAAIVLAGLFYAGMLMVVRAMGLH